MKPFGPTLLLIFAAVLLASPDPVSIRVVNPALLAGQSIRVYCYVEHAARNRELTLSVEGYRSSTWELEGEAAPRVYERTFDHVPCGVETASCVLKDEVGRTYRAARPVYVTGCEQ